MMQGVEMLGDRNVKSIGLPETRTMKEGREGIAKCILVD
jgi:hypothetical protein